jgi:hypothetical protein
VNKVEASGQGSVPYGFRHEIQVKNPNRSEMAAHFTSKGEAPNEGTAAKAAKPGGEK